MNIKYFKFIIYGLPVLAFSMLMAYGANDTDTSDSFVALSRVSGHISYQYRIAAATNDWYSDILDVRGKDFVALEIYEATGATAADRTGTVGTGDFYLRGLVHAGAFLSADNGILPSSVSPSFIIPYKYSPMLSNGTISDPSDVAIDLYGLSLYDVRGLTHVFVYVSTNNVDNTVIVGVE